MEIRSDFFGKSLLTLMEYTPDEIAYFIDWAIELKRLKRAGIHNYYLKDKNIAMVFEKTSTRTRCATSIACLDEGGHADFLGKDAIQLGKKESIKDTARVLGRMYDGILYRGYEQKSVEMLAEHSGVPVINGLTDDFHPTQVLADLMTAKECFGKIRGLKMAYIGDGRNNMANSLMLGCVRMEMDFAIGAPKNLFPAEKIIKKAEEMKGSRSVLLTEDPYEAVKGADIIYTDVWVSMGEENQQGIKERIESLNKYQVNKELMEATGKDSVFFHCLPASHENGVHCMEVTEDVFESPNSLVFEEAENRMHTIKAMLTLLIGGGRK
ncbi:MAG: ornithine carbamoyltransferase [Spirochaetales bacterium]|nr:ornithine carbamoyltransferase [Spirochaetales bacterium]